MVFIVTVTSTLSGKKHVAPEYVYPFNYSKTEFDAPGMARKPEISGVSFYVQ